jgi:hypothetical protein
MAEGTVGCCRSLEDVGNSAIRPVTPDPMEHDSAGTSRRVVRAAPPGTLPVMVIGIVDDCAVNAVETEPLAGGLDALPWPSALNSQRPACMEVRRRTCGCRRPRRVDSRRRCFVVDDREELPSAARPREFGDLHTGRTEPATGGLRRGHDPSRSRSPAMPPSIARAVPVTDEAIGLTRYAIPAATSSALTRRPIGCLASSAARSAVGSVA